MSEYRIIFGASRIRRGLCPVDDCPESPEPGSVWCARHGGAEPKQQSRRDGIEIMRTDDNANSR